MLAKTVSLWNQVISRQSRNLRCTNVSAPESGRYLWYIGVCARWSKQFVTSTHYQLLVPFKNDFDKKQNVGVVE